MILPYPPVGFFFKVVMLPKTSGSPESMIKAGVMSAVSVLMGETSFQEVSGLSFEIQTETIQEGGENRFAYKVPKSVQYPNLVLKRGLSFASSPLDLWCIQTIQSGNFDIELKDIAVELTDVHSKMPLVVWNLMNAYPVKYQVSNFNAERNELVIETLELAYQRSEKLPNVAAFTYNALPF